MLSRRNIRIKVMQALYAHNRDKAASFEDLKKGYLFSVHKSYDLYLFNLWLLSRVADYAKVDYSKKRTKLVPTEKDRNFIPKLADNPISSLLIHSEDFRRECETHSILRMTDPDFINQLYRDFSVTEKYDAYLNKKDSDVKDHMDILLALYKFCVSHELFNDLIEDNFINWIDDKSIVLGSIKKTLKALPISEGDFYEPFLPNAETVEDFGMTLLTLSFEKDLEYNEIIKPFLENWDFDRMAVIDRISLKLAIAEFMEFPSIPSKVTLNEYVDLSKSYSTEKSKEFVNGILDRMLKQLIKDGKINKEGRGLVE
jgi:N utilization substance protein B